jgi:glycosyltransferase involved in cell wall biosynthesis
MVNVIFYTDTPIHGGAENHMLLLAKNLNRERYSVSLVCSAYKQLDEWCKAFEDAGIRVYRLNVVHKHDPRHRSQLKKILKKEMPHVLHLHLWNPGACRYAFTAFELTKTKLIATEHHPFVLRGVKRTFKKACLRKTHHTIVASNSMKDFMLEQYPELEGKISVVENGIDIESFENTIFNFRTQQRNSYRKENFNCEGNETVITSVAALQPHKGLKYLIEAYKDVQIKFPKTRLVIAGEGPERKSLEKLIRNLNLDNKVMLLGNRDDIPFVLKASDLFVLPSISEAFGLVLLEAMAAKLPVIATNTGGIPEIIEDQKSGIIVEQKNSSALSEAICDLLRNEALQEKLAFVGNRRVRDFDVSIMAHKTAQIYEK